MQIISTNIAEPTTISWKGRQLQTGYYKKPTNQPIYLGKYDVKGDNVIDRRYHGGEFKACYIFSANHYGYWKRLYANLDWEYGMFGENLTVSGFNETQVQIGNIYKVGETLVQVTQPREPCFKVGIKFGTQKVLEQFIEHGYPGTYLRVLKEGTVSTGDEFELVKKNVNSLTVHQFFNLLFAKTKDQELLKLAIKNDALPISKREKLKTFLR